MPQTYRFGEFALDLDAQQLRLRGKALRVERRPMDLLVLLVTRHGQLVLREDIIAALWPANVIIDFDSGLNTLVRKVRHALGDSSATPTFVETVPGRGYRFIAAVTAPDSVDPEPGPPLKTRAPWLTRPVATLVVAVLVVAGLMFVWQSGFREPGQTRIAILPFENLTGDDELAYLAAGIAEETNLSLARIDLPNLSVIGVVSARAVAGSEEPLQKIGRELDVDFIVLSSLRLDDSLIRVTSRLIRVADGKQVWSASFDRELTNILGLQRELSVAIAEQIRQRLSPAVAAAIDRRQTQNPEAFELYLKGRYEWTRFLPDSVPRALRYYQQAVAKDPRYALAWAGIAHALITSPVTAEASRDSIYPSAADALQRALETGRDLAETQLALGSFYFFLEHDLPAAEVAARQAVTLDPNSAMSFMFLGLVLSQKNNFVEARAVLQRARELDPMFPLMFANSAMVALRADAPREALELATQATAIDPEFWVGHLHLGSARLALGDYDGALQAFSNAEKFSGNNSTRSTSARAYVLAKLGRQDEARDVLAELIAQSEERRVSLYYIALVYAGLAETDSAFEWLERGLTGDDVSCLSIEKEPMLDNLRGDLRFETLLNWCGLPPTSGGAE